jgi:hypothetical protein
MTSLGFSGTGSKLEERIGQAIDLLVQARKVGEGSTGLAVVATPCAWSPREALKAP